MSIVTFIIDHWAILTTLAACAVLFLVVYKMSGSAQWAVTAVGALLTFLEAAKIYKSGEDKERKKTEAANQAALDRYRADQAAAEVETDEQARERLKRFSDSMRGQ